MIRYVEGGWLSASGCDSMLWLSFPLDSSCFELHSAYRRTLYCPPHSNPFKVYKNYEGIKYHLSNFAHSINVLFRDIEDTAMPSSGTQSTTHPSQLEENTNNPSLPLQVQKYASLFPVLVPVQVLAIPEYRGFKTDLKFEGVICMFSVWFYDPHY